MKIFNIFKKAKSTTEDSNIETLEKNQVEKTIVESESNSNFISSTSEREIKVETASSGGTNQ